MKIPRPISLIAVLLALGCGDGPGETSTAPSSSTDAEVQRLDDVERLFRVSMALRGLRPTAEEIAAVQADPAVLEGLVDGWLGSEAFAATIRDMHAEMFLTRTDVEPQFPSVGVLEGVDTMRIYTSTTEAALKLVEHVVMNDRPYSEIVTADYMLTDETLATVYGVAYDPSGPEWQESVWVDGRPMAGVLSDSEMWRRHVSNGSNFHRGRANFVAATFLCDDLASRTIVVEGGIDLSDELAVANAVKTNPVCIACHQTLDPLAGFFWGWEDRVLAFSVEKAHRFGCHWNADNTEEEVDRPEEWCYPLKLYTPAWEDDWEQWDLRPPSYYGQPGDTLPELGQYIAEDPRFARCMSKRFYSYFTQTPLDEVPLDVSVPLQDSFTASDFDARALIKQIVLSDDFTVVQASEGYDGVPVGLQSVRPEQYTRTVEQLTGFRWLAHNDPYGCDIACDDPDNPGLKGCDTDCYGEVDLGVTDRYGYRAMSGGIDGYSTTRPTWSPTPTKAMVMERFAYEAASFVVDEDFAKSASERRLLTLVEPGETSESAVRAQLADLHLRLLAEQVAADDEVVTETYGLWADALARSGTDTHAWKLTLGTLLQDPRVVFY